MIKELKNKDLLDEKHELELALHKLEHEYDQLRIKFENNSTHLQAQFETEKDSRDSWKERYEREFQNGIRINKQMN